MELDFDQYKAQQFCDNPECQYYRGVITPFPMSYAACGLG
jgi:hypothetical protein